VKATIWPTERFPRMAWGAADPDDDDHADVHAHRQDGRHCRHGLQHQHRAAGEILVGRLEALALEIGPHEGLDQPRPGDVLLQNGVELVEPLLHGSKERLHPDDEKDDEHGRDNEQRQQGQSQGGAGADHEDQAADHQKRGAGAYPQGDLDHALDGARVAGQADHQLAGLLFIEVGKGECLNPGEKGVTQIAGHALPDLDGEDVVYDGEQHAQKRNAEHQKRRSDNHLLVVLSDPLIDDPLDQPGDRKIHEDQRGQQDQGQDGAFPVRSDERGEFEYLVHCLSIGRVQKGAIPGRAAPLREKSRDYRPEAGVRHQVRQRASSLGYGSAKFSLWP